MSLEPIGNQLVDLYNQGKTFDVMIIREQFFYKGAREASPSP